MTKRQNVIHQRALECARNYKTCELDLVSVLHLVRTEKVHRSLGCDSIFSYALEKLEFSPAHSYALDKLAAMITDIPRLGEVIFARRLSPSLASRLLCAITAENAAELIAFAETHTYRDVDRFVAGKKPLAKYKNSIRWVRADLAKVITYVEIPQVNDLNLVIDLHGKGTKDMHQVFGKLLADEVERKHPVRKAERAATRKTKPKFSVKKGRTPVSAAERHATNLETGGRCTFIGPDGRRCNSIRFTEMHHLRLVSQGGGNEAENLTVLCSVHHDLVHQLMLPGMEPMEWTIFPYT